VCGDSCEVTGGLATFGEIQVRMLRELDEAVLHWARNNQAIEMAFPPVVSVSMLDRMDYFKNFPHLGFAVAPLTATVAGELAERGGLGNEVLPSSATVDAEFMLPSAACYPIYAHFRDRTLAATTCVTTVQNCFRNETHYEGLARLRAFRMREIVALGTRDALSAFLGRHKAWVRHFAQGADLPLSIQVATDPFFQADGARTRMQQLFPVKEEFVFEGQVAVSSVNSHRNFFAERWNIRTDDDQYAYTGCVAFGLERWVHALQTRYEGDLSRGLRAIQAGRAHAEKQFEASQGGA
jgi:seryl-tRNA synthetase